MAGLALPAALGAEPYQVPVYALGAVLLGVAGIFTFMGWKTSGRNGLLRGIALVAVVTGGWFLSVLEIPEALRAIRGEDFLLSFGVWCLFMLILTPNALRIVNDLLCDRGLRKLPKLQIGDMDVMLLTGRDTRYMAGYPC